MSSEKDEPVITSEPENTGGDAQITGQTVQGKEPWFEVAQDQNKKWHWVLWSGNGRQIARNSMMYERQKDVQGAIKALVRAAALAKIIVKVHK